MLPLDKINGISPWKRDKDSLFSLFQSQPNGLSETEAKGRLAIFGRNELVAKREEPVLIEFLKKFLDPLILILLFASAISAVLGEFVNFIIISVMLSMSVLIDFFQERQARTAAAKLRQKVSLTATVIRDHKKYDIKASELVPGDMIFLSAGDIVPADARLIQSRSLLVNQSALTGESFPQEKNDRLIKADTEDVSAITNMVFMGTNVLQGEAEALITFTGHNTRLGQIAKDLDVQRPPTDFEIGVRRFGFLLMRLTMTLVIFVFFANALFRHEIIDSFLFALALAVGLTPELLPIVITTNLSRGATKMAKSGVIVKNLPSIQNLGGMQVLATDKTGTITQDKIHLERYEDVYGKDSRYVLLFGFINSFFQSGIKNPMEKAVMAHREVDIKSYQKVDEIPFDFERKRLSVIVSHRGSHYLVTKGAPEAIFSLSTHFFHDQKSHPLSETISEKLIHQFTALSQKGYRVLAVAYKKIDLKKHYSHEDESHLTLLGLMAFLDPPKKDVREALEFLTQNGIEMKILTGDNELVTERVCQEIGLPIKGVVVGRTLESLSSDELFRVAKNNTIFARLNPNQKERLILNMKRHGVTVGFLGDGINDAPSLHAADVGISVDNAVDVAKEAADLILLKKDLHVLKDGIIEGRKTFANVMKYVMMGTSSNFGNMVSVAIASLFLPFLPMLPVQILLNNFLYDTSQIFLSGDLVDSESIQKPVRWDMGFITRFTFIFGPISSIFDFLTFALMLFVFRAGMSLFQTGWFVESLVTQTLIIFSIRTSVQPFYKSKPSLPLLLSSIAIIAFAVSVPFITPIAKLFGFVKLPLIFYLILVVFVLGYFNLVEKTKCWFYSKYRTSLSIV